MIIVMKKNATEKEIQHVAKRIEEMGLKPHLSRGVERTVIGAIGDERLLKEDQIKAIASVDSVLPIMKPYKLVSREFKKEDTIVKVGNIEIGGKNIVVIAGPCAVESREQIIETAKAVKKNHLNFYEVPISYRPRTYAEGKKIGIKEGKLLLFKFGGELSFSSDLSNELSFEFPKKIIVVAYSKGAGINISMRGKNVRDIVLKAIEGLEDATGGGHKDAVGARVRSEDWGEFIKKVEEIVIKN